MQVTETLAEGLKREFRVVIGANDINEKLEHRLLEIGEQVKVPGFRPGKVPLQILKQRFGSSVMGEVVERAVNDSSNQALNEKGVRPALQPKIEIVAFDEGKDLEYTMAIEVMPDINIMDFAKVELEQVTVEATEGEIDEAVKRLASQLKQTEPIAKPRKSKSGDVLVIDFRGSVDGEELPGMAGEDHHLELGSNRFIEGFEEQLIGLDGGEERTITVTFPKEYANDKLAGRETKFDVKIKEIREAILPEIDDEMAKSMGAENLTELRGKVKEQIEREYQQITRARLKRGLLDQLAEGHDFEAPPGMVDAEFEAIWQQVKSDLDQGKVDPEDEGKSEEDLQSEYREIAGRRVRLGLLLSEVGRANSIDVTQDELNRALMSEAQRYPGKEREVFEFYQKTPEALANLRAPIFEDKVVDFITALAKVTERSMTAAELAAEESAEAEKADDKSAKKPAKKAAAKKAPAKKPAAKKAAAKKSDKGDSESEKAESAKEGDKG